MVKKQLQTPSKNNTILTLVIITGRLTLRYWSLLTYDALGRVNRAERAKPTTTMTPEANILT